MPNHELLNFNFATTDRSEEFLTRLSLYSQIDSLKQNGKIKTVAFCNDTCESLAYILYKSGIFTCIFNSSCDSLPLGAFFIKGENSEHRVLAYRPDKGEDIANCDALFQSIIRSLKDIPVKTLTKGNSDISDLEKYLTDAEFYDTAAAILSEKSAHTETFKNEWKNLFEGKNISDSVYRICSQAKTALDLQNKKDIIFISKDNIELIAMKMCEDSSGDVIIRIKETQGVRETRAFIKSKIFDMAFWFDIEHYETKTFRINREGFAREVNINEGLKNG